MGMTDPALPGVFRDPALDAELATGGPVRVPVLDESDIAELLASYRELVPADESGMRLDYVRPDRSLVRALADMMAPQWDRIFDELFVDHVPMLTSFVAKHPGDDSDFFLHRDVAGNDERSVVGHTIWIPLADVSPEIGNGPLEIIPNSQHLPSGYEGVDATQLLAPYRRWLLRLLEPLSVPAGVGLVYPSRLLHASGANRTDTLRVAVGCMVVRRDRPTVHVMATGRRHRVVYAVDRDFFIDHHPADLVVHGMPPGYEVLDEFDLGESDLDPEVLPDAIAAVLGTPDRPEREVELPVDLQDGRTRRPFARLTTLRWASHRTDLDISAADLEPVDGDAAEPWFTEIVGSVGARPLRRGSRRVGKLPPSVPDVIVPLRPPSTRDATLVVVDPFSRVTVTAPRRVLHHDEVVAIETPAMRSGLFSATHAGDFDLGVRYALPAGDPVTIWNDGPGPLVALLRSTPSRR